MSMNEYSKKIHLQSNEIARGLLDIFAEKKNILINDVLEPTKEEQAKIDEETTDFALGVVDFLTKQGVTVNYATFAIDKLVGSLNGLKQFVDGTMRTWEDEYLSRSYGVKNEDGKFRKEEVTIGQLLVKLNEVREATGDKETFYNEVAPEMPGDESPYTEEVLADK